MRFSHAAGALAMVLVAGFCIAAQRPAQAAGAAAYCSANSSHAAAQHVPPALVASVARAFDISADMVGDAASVRCVGTKLLACWVGANLDCGKADTRRNLTGATAFCQANPGSAIVPMVATGHDTIYDWHCNGRRAVAGKSITHVDAQGYIAGNWKVLQ